MNVDNDMSINETRQMLPFRTVAAMVNATCNLNCPHCDLPNSYKKYNGALSPKQWKNLIESIIEKLSPEVIAVSATEPLLNKGVRSKTLAILETASAQNTKCGIVTNGTFLREFFNEMPTDLKIDYLDVSVEGYGAIDDAMRGEGHFSSINQALRSLNWNIKTENLFISTCLNSFNSKPNDLRKHLNWVKSISDTPRAALLFMYNNEHTSSELRLTQSMILDILEVAVEAAEDFKDLFIEVFPYSIPNLEQFIESDILPGPDKLMRDSNGILVGHVAGNLYIRYVTPLDLVKYHLRISPEGHILKPEGIESKDYLSFSYGDFISEDWSIIWENIMNDFEKRKKEAFEFTVLN